MRHKSDRVIVKTLLKFYLPEKLEVKKEGNISAIQVDSAYSNNRWNFNGWARL